MVESLDDVIARMEEDQPAVAIDADVQQGLDVVALWPEAFEGLDGRQCNAIRQSFASHWHEGWEPTREDVVDLAAVFRGEIDRSEYLRRGDERARSGNGLGR